MDKEVKKISEKEEKIIDDNKKKPKEVKEEKTTKKEKKKIEEEKINSSEEKVNSNNEEKRCKKCNNILSKNDKYCFICGAKQENEKPKEIDKKVNAKTIFLPIVIFIILIFIVYSVFFVIRYLDNSTDNIDRSNKSVTVNDTGIADAVEKVYDSVVVIENYVNGRLYATGSGFVYKTDNSYGYVLTNSHVISNATSIKLGFTNDKKVEAEVVGVDDYSDIAVLKIAKKYVIQVAEIGSTKDMRVGDTTFAVGTPLDAKAYSWSVTRGILSGKDRVVSSGSSYMTVLQTDTPINSGNSGGPLCNANGEVIGITNMKLASDQIEGMGFAIPIETATGYADSFVKGNDVRHPYIGVSIYDSGTSFFSSETYVVIESVEKGSPADEAGLKAGDVIVSIEDEKIENSSYFKYKLYSYEIGDTIKIKVERNGKEKVYKVKLESNSKSA